MILLDGRIILEKWYITWCMLRYEWNIGVYKPEKWLRARFRRSSTDAGWAFDVSPFWLRKWR